MKAGITVITAAVKRTLDRIERNKPFALSKAVNETAKDVQQAEIKNLGQKQTLRGDWYKPGRKHGINIKPFATKAKPTAIVGTQADWEGLHETGGTKKPRDGKKLAIASEEHRGGRAQKISRSKRPRAVLQRAKTFLAVMPSGLRGIFRRIGRARTPIKLLFALVPLGRIKRALGYKETGEAVANKRLPEHFENELRKAIK